MSHPKFIEKCQDRDGRSCGCFCILLVATANEKGGTCLVQKIQNAPMNVWIDRRFFQALYRKDTTLQDFRSPGHLGCDLFICKFIFSQDRRKFCEPNLIDLQLFSASYLPEDLFFASASIIRFLDGSQRFYI
jgi:hypothetical protein